MFAYKDTATRGVIKMNQNRKVMAYTKLIVEKQDNICTVKINNPEALNALNSTI